MEDKVASSAPSVDDAKKAENKPGFFARFKKKKPDEDAEPPKPKVPFTSLFRYATPIEKVYVVIGAIASAGHGALMPAMTIFFGRVMEDFTKVEVGTAASLIGSQARWFFVLGAAAMVLSMIQVRFLNYVAVRNGIRIRRMYFRSLMAQDRAWYDGETTGELTARVAGDVDIIQAGMGDKIGTAAQFLSQAVVGMILAFVYSWRLSLVVLSFSPLLGISGAIFSKIMVDSTGEGQGAYGEAGAVATETFNLIKTVHAFGGQKEESRRYDSKLSKAYRAGVIKGVMNGAGMGGKFAEC